MNTLFNLGWTETLQQQLEAVRQSHDDDLVAARVAADHGMQYEIVGLEGTRRAQVSGRLRHDSNNPEATPAVGDWVCVRLIDEGHALIIDTLPRRSRLVRQASGKRTAMQIVGTNLDVVFVVSSLNLDLNLRRLERYMTAVFEGGATPVIVLTKADLVEDVAPIRSEVETVAKDVAIVVTDAKSGAGIEQVTAFLKPGMTGAFVGSSGVGKSTLVNAMMGQPIQAVAEIREHDDRGRHTTTHRQMLMLPGGGVVIDTPGMREFQIWESTEGIGDAFEDIEALAGACGFRDCEHGLEPGCAVQGAILAGQLDAERLASYEKLGREADFQKRRQDVATALAQKQENKRISKHIRRHTKNRGR
ncbi:MAG: ribosome small subunit-dependent GTPase A [Bradymonadaceae bacterium]|nr:ribosome small subunit-dependent GTPase A [Lujinxingiaceae bacterium]